MAFRSEAMIRAEAGWPKLLKDVEGQHARLLVDVPLHGFKIPAGSEGTLQSYSRGWHRLHFTGPTCECCGVTPYAYGLSWKSFEIIKREESGDGNR